MGRVLLLSFAAVAVVASLSPQVAGAAPPPGPPAGPPLVDAVVESPLSELSDAEIGELGQGLGELSDAELVVRSRDVLALKFDLLPGANPINADAPGFEETHARFRTTQRVAALLLIELQGRGLQLSEVAVATMSMPGGRDDGVPPTPPPAGDFLAAIGELDDLAGVTVPSGTTDTGSDTSSSGPGAGVVVAGLAGAGAVGGIVAVVGCRRRRHRRVALDLARADALTDPLTGLANRRRLDADVAELDGRAGLGGVAVMMVDIDHFKSFNDRYGHQVGDEVLRSVGEVLAATVRATDVVYRYGGEEFCVLLPDATIEEASEVAARIHDALAAAASPDHEGLTVSIGLSTGVVPGVDGTIHAADGALYDAKRRGRNRTALA